MLLMRRALPVFATCWALLASQLSGCAPAEDPTYYQTGGLGGDGSAIGGRAAGGQNAGSGGERSSGGAASGGAEADAGGSGGDDESGGTGGQGEGSGGQAAGGTGSGGNGSGGATICDGECRFVWPLRGEVSRDWTVSNYIDLEPGAEILDFRGGERSYDGHQGVDIAIASFRTMDLGIPIYAVAPGIVTAVHDGELDRNTIANVNDCNAIANTIYVTHDDGREARYLHLRKDSIVVEVGEEIASGQELGEVGSSGCSHSPHLHLEVFEPGGALVDPFEEGLWLDPPDYDAPPKVMEVILMAGPVSSVEAVQTAPPSPSSVAAGYNFGISIISGGTREGAVEQITFYQNDAYGFTLPSHTFDGTERHYMRWWSVSVDAGNWRAEVSLDGEVVEEVEFLAE